MNDQYQRNITYARISLTQTCNLRCAYCQPNEEQDLETIPFDELKILIKALANIGITKIRFTGGEPLLYPHIVEAIAFTKSIESIKDIGITTNAILLKKYVKQLAQAGLSRINISLDTLNSKTFKDLTKVDGLNEVLQGIDLALENNILVKTNTVILKEINYLEIKDIINYAHSKKILARFIELMPIGNNDTYYDKNFVSANTIIEALQAKPIETACGEVNKLYETKDGKTFGLITPLSNHFCSSCNRIRITSSGQIRLCLHDDQEVKLDLKEGLELEKTLIDLIYQKPKEHSLKGKRYAKKVMSKIGG
ncbi:MAG: GTP 3',8-cyclase MoaA [Bacilli bacterium]